ncbi:hypothetical protein ACIP2Y_43845 [Streptomyces sviceus]|uniref:hypothetical protein n=1 Tax=Streptomyces sviceus TaxID=285530 RepID=UPI00380A4955
MSGRCPREAGLPSALVMYERVTKELYFLPYPMSYLRRSNDEHKRIRAALATHDGALTARLSEGLR